MAFGEKVIGLWTSSSLSDIQNGILELPIFANPSQSLLHPLLEKFDDPDHIYTPVGVVGTSLPPLRLQKVQKIVLSPLSMDMSGHLFLQTDASLFCFWSLSQEAYCFSLHPEIQHRSHHQSVTSSPKGQSIQGFCDSHPHHTLGLFLEEW